MEQETDDRKQAKEPCENCNAALRYLGCFLSFDPVYSNHRKAHSSSQAPPMGPTTPPPPSCWSFFRSPAHLLPRRAFCFPGSV